MIMPTYEYKCKKCGKIFDWQQRITEDAINICPNEVCVQEVKGEGEVFRKISKNVGLIFTGTGFYITDYVRKNSSAASQSNGNGKAQKNGNGSENKKSTKVEKSNGKAEKSDTKEGKTA